MTAGELTALILICGVLAGVFAVAIMDGGKR